MEVLDETNGKKGFIKLPYSEYIITNPEELSFVEPRDEDLEEKKAARRARFEYLRYYLIAAVAGYVCALLFFGFEIYWVSTVLAILGGLCLYIMIDSCQYKVGLLPGTVIYKEKYINKYYVTVIRKSPKKIKVSYLEVSRSTYDKVSEGSEVYMTRLHTYKYRAILK